jgi:hypothetical protein
MRRFTLPLVIAGCIALAALLTWLALSTATFGRRVTADGAVASGPPVTVPLPPFRRIDVSGTAEVVLVQGETEAATYAQPAGASYVTATVREGTLYLETGDRARWWDMLLDRRGSGTSHVTVMLKDLDAIDAAGTVKITAATLRASDLAISGAGGTSIHVDKLTAQSLSVEGAGALRAVLAGTVTKQEVSISGAGEYRAADLLSQDATVSVAGAGQVIVNASRTLDATISGAGSVEYLGDPKVTERVSGIGSVKRRAGATASAPQAIATVAMLAPADAAR